MEDLDKLNPNFVADGLIDPSQLLQNLETKKSNQIKEIRLGGDGLMERVSKKVVTNDGRELLF